MRFRAYETPAHSAAAKTVSKLITLASDDCASYGDAAATATAHAASLAGRWRRVEVDLREPAPQARRNAACAALDGYLYVFGGTLDDGRKTAAGDFWRLPLPGHDSDGDGAPPRWERMKRPEEVGGPPASCAACAHARPGSADGTRPSILVVVTPEAAWIYEPEAEPAWSKLAQIWHASHERAAMGIGMAVREVLPASTLSADGLLLLFLTFAEGVVMSGTGKPTLGGVCLADGRGFTHAFSPFPAAAPPSMLFAQAWHDGSTLRLWSGFDSGAFKIRIGSQFTYGRWAGLYKFGEPAMVAVLDEMWELPLRCTEREHGLDEDPKWRRTPHDGGGTGPPLCRAYSACVALPPPEGADAPPQVLVVGGRCEFAVFRPSGELDETEDHIFKNDRFLCDAHLWSRDDGWRRVRLPVPGAPGEPTRPPGGIAHAGLAFDAVTRRAYVAGGGGSAEDAHSFACNVYELIVDGVCGADSTSSACDADRAASNRALDALRRGPFMQRTGLAFSEELQPLQPAAYADALRRAASARHEPSTSWLISWTCIKASAAENEDSFGLSVAVRNTTTPPFFQAICTGPPTAADLAWALLAPLAGLRRASRQARPGAVRFSARTAGQMQLLLPLLDALGIAPELETWVEAAELALAYNNDPWGAPDDGVGARCARCGKKASSGRLRKCGSCRRARYCGAECSAADWPAHKPACAVLKRGAVGRWVTRPGPDGQTQVWEPTQEALAAALSALVDDTDA